MAKNYQTKGEKKIGMRRSKHTQKITFILETFVYGGNFEISFRWLL